MAKTFKPRTTAPAANNKYYIHKSHGGLGETILISKATGSVLPNCVGFCWSRAFESWGKRPNLSRGNAEDWWNHTSDGYKRGKTPKLGAVICWRKGRTGYGADGAGHVAFVEKINPDGSILVSNSNYSGARFFTRTLTGPAWTIGAGLTFQGFIYPPVELVLEKPKSKITLTNYDAPKKIKKGNYFTITGKITSTLNLAKTQVAIMDSKGTTKYKYTAAPGTKTWDVHKADQAMMFRKLAKGTYTYKITAWDQNGSHTLLNQTFKVV